MESNITRQETQKETQFQEQFEISVTWTEWCDCNTVQYVVTVNSALGIFMSKEEKHKTIDWKKVVKNENKTKGFDLNRKSKLVGHDNLLWTDDS